MNRTREQRRAGYALHFVKKDPVVADLSVKEKQKLHTLIQKAPIQILQNGLGQMLAFLLADNEKPSDILYRHIEEWLCGHPQPGHPCRVYLNDPKQEELIEQLTAGDRNQYTQAQQEALALFAWLKKFADAWLKEG